MLLLILGITLLLAGIAAGTKLPALFLENEQEDEKILDEEPQNTDAPEIDTSTE